MGVQWGVPIWISGLIATVGAALYLPTVASGPLWLDPSEFIAGAFTLGIVHPPGHPSYVLLAKLASFLPLGGIAFRIHLLSAVFGIVSAHLLASVVFHIAQKIWKHMHVILQNHQRIREV